MKFAATWMDMGSIKMRKMSKRERERYRIITFGNIKKHHKRKIPK